MFVWWYSSLIIVDNDGKALFFWSQVTYVTLDRKTSHKGTFFENEIYKEQ